MKLDQFPRYVGLFLVGIAMAFGAAGCSDDGDENDGTSPAGTWIVSYTVQNTATILFQSGESTWHINADGTTENKSCNRGTWTLAGEAISIIWNGGYTYTGTFAGNKMSGDISQNGRRIGGWSASRQ